MAEASALGLPSPLMLRLPATADALERSAAAGVRNTCGQQQLSSQVEALATQNKKLASEIARLSDTNKTLQDDNDALNARMKQLCDASGPKQWQVSSSARSKRRVPADVHDDDSTAENDGSGSDESSPDSNDNLHAHHQNKAARLSPDAVETQ